jgi:hypothetical protein
MLNGKSWLRRFIVAAHCVQYVQCGAMQGGWESAMNVLKSIPEVGPVTVDLVINELGRFAVSAR